MSNTPNSSRPNVVIKGSWEDLLTQAHRAAANQNDEAIGLYEKVRDGLRRLPETQRQANKGRLGDLLTQAAANLHVFLTQRESYDEALAALDQVVEIVDEDERRAWEQRRAMVLAQAGRHEDAIRSLRSLATGDDARLSDWGNVATQHIRFKQFAEAAAVIEEAEGWQQQQAAAGQEHSARSDEDQAYLANLHSLLAFAQNDYPEAIRWFERASELDSHFRDQPHLLYVRLIFHDQTELALPWTERDQQHSMRAKFWQGVALKRQGKADAAQRKWEQVLKAINPQTNNEEFVETILSLYYLGDPNGVGLNAVLRGLQSGGAQSWLMLFLAGLGWMLRGNLNSARADLALAVTRRKAGAEGTLLPPEVWQYCRDLLSEEDQAKIVEYFQTER